MSSAYVPAYATSGGDVEPTAKRPRRTGRLAAPEPETVSAAEFEQMKRDLEIEHEQPSRHTSTLTQRLSHTPAESEPPSRPTSAKRATDGAPGVAAQARRGRCAPHTAERSRGRRADVPAPDIAENEGVAPVQKQKAAPKSRSRNRRHGRRR